MNGHDSTPRDSLPDLAVSGPEYGRRERGTTSALRIMAIIIPVALVAATVVLGAAFGWHEPLLALFKPGLAPGKGKVTFNGKPLETGFVNTQPSSSLAEPALGPLGPGGEFEFMTNGEPGIAVGEHRVLVFSMGGGFPPPSNIPTVYNTAETTPFTITVAKDSAANVFEFNLEGEAPGGGGGGGRQGSGGGGPPASERRGGPPADADAAVPGAADEPRSAEKVP